MHHRWLTDIRAGSWELDEDFLDFLEKLFERTKDISTESWLNVVKSIRQRQSIEDMVREQNYKGFDRQKFDQIVEELDINDPTGQLLKLLTPQRFSVCKQLPY